MTLAMTLVSRYGVWASTDHRLTEHPSGRLITDSSVKHAVLRCRDGCALISYTGLGRLGRIDLSRWIREVLRGEGRTVDESLIDLREQATARLGMGMHAAGLEHTFLAGALLAEQPWAVEIRNFQPPTALVPGGLLQPEFSTAALRVETSMLMVGGSGRDAVLDADRALLTKISQRRPSRPEDFMRVMGDVSRRAAERRHPAAQAVSRSATVVFMPVSGDGVKQEWYGPEEERHLAPPGFSHLLFGIDLSEMVAPMLDHLQALREGHLDDDEFNRRTEEAGRRAVKAKGRRDVPGALPT